MKKINNIYIALMLLVFGACDDFDSDLDVQNLEEPSSTQIGIESTADNLFKNWYQTVNSYYGPGLALATMSDQMTASYGNGGMRDMSSEPRVAWNNNSTYGNAVITEDYFNSLHAVLADANAIVIGVEGDGIFSDPVKYESFARFGQAAAIGNLALFFDRVFLSDETGVVNDGEAVSYMEAINFALDKLDMAIELADAADFTVDTQINGMSLSSDEWSEFLNTFAARLLVNSARNSSERASLDWNRVLDYAENGLTYDLEILSDGGVSWYSEYAYYSIYPGWLRVDMRIINLMDSDYPDYWPADKTVLPEASSADKRLESDFQYLSSQDFSPDRGTYHFSSYRLSRYDDYVDSGLETALPEMLMAENQLYLAEANLQLGNIAEAASIINSGSRTERGGLDGIDATEEAVDNAIFYERMVELINTGMGLAYFEMRGRDLLQEGTPLHFPIPGAALDAAGIPNYTFGGSQGVAGEDYSNGGWR